MFRNFVNVEVFIINLSLWDLKLKIAPSEIFDDEIINLSL